MHRGSATLHRDVIARVLALRNDASKRDELRARDARRCLEP
jgi:hypothetical protein